MFTAASKKEALDVVDADLKTVKRVIEKDAKLREYLQNPTINRIEKKAGVQQLLAAGKYNDLTKNFFDTLAENGRLYDTVKIINSYGSLMAANRGEIQVTITSAKVTFPIISSLFLLKMCRKNRTTIDRVATLPGSFLSTISNSRMLCNF